jgi:DNA-binding winged helix-turn-helix (wHTH) protein
MPRTGEVMLLRWPAEAARRARYKAMGVLRLLVVEGGAPAPICSDIREDWVRAPITDADLRARMATLSAKAEAHRLPQIDPYGILRFSDRSTSVSPTETDLLECLIRQFQSLVPRDELRDCLPERTTGGSRNALDLHIMRLRRRIQPLGLIIQTVRGRGYMLQTATDEPTHAWTRPRPRRTEPDRNTTPPQPTNPTNAEVTPLRWPRTRRIAAG